MLHRTMGYRLTATLAIVPALGLTFALAALVLWPTGVSASEPNEGMVKLHFAGSIRLVDLVDYVSSRTQARFIYDQSLTGDVVLQSPLEVSVGSLIPMLRSILEFKGYRLTEAEGWYRIERRTGDSLGGREAPAALVRAEDLPDDPSPNGVYTVLFETRQIAPDEFANVLRASLGVTAVRVPSTRILIVTDYGRNVRLAAALANVLDRSYGDMTVASHAFRHVQVAQVKDIALELLRAKVLPDLGEVGERVAGPKLLVDPAGNRVMLVVPPEKVDACHAVLEDLDVSGDVEMVSYAVGHTDTRHAAAFIREVVKARAPGVKTLGVYETGGSKLVVVAHRAAQEIVAEAVRMLEEAGSLELRYYPVKHVQVARINTLACSVLGLQESPDLRGEMLLIAAEENTLIARLSPEKHERLAQLLHRFDVPREVVRAARTRFYRIRNTDAEELAQRLRAVLGMSLDGTLPAPGRPLDDPVARSQYIGIRRTDQHVTIAAPPSDVPEESGPGSSRSVRPGQAAAGPTADIRIVADKNTNTIIVSAAPELHETIARLVDYLDRRQPQVLIEATIASVSAGSDLTVAVELLENDVTGGTDALVFSAFGLSTVDVATGTMALKTGKGVHASIVDPDGTTAIIRALRSDSKSRVIAEPKILVNNNATGSFESVREEPFTSLNVGDTVATTTFAGYVEAGLTITVTPHISEGDFVVLDYAITSRDFGESSAEDGVPPPRTSDVISSSVTVPNGYTAVVGGLQRDRGSTSQDKVPILGSIPVLGILFRSTTKGASGSRFFVFLRPVILRDEDFADLKHLSQADLSESTKRARGVDAIYPPVQPKLIR